MRDGTHSHLDVQRLEQPVSSIWHEANDPVRHDNNSPRRQRNQHGVAADQDRRLLPWGVAEVKAAQITRLEIIDTLGAG